ncbi:PIG-L deacetylase family protein [Rhodothermus marinus]|uniref:PIG-L deacetylase family protein n=1 Tax=Rhodothermus marinus TaxID=29549 RepID=UPI0012BA4A72|nr:PIG-L family deacetylase [Rhodothermus marinus]BBM71004.1 GlcNAc-PI de-N-acetylase [Rhodothermus marinus]BBM73983.1 GlcNAc-PI de-N-acetylase [Rhodothermus marinus]
MATLLYIFPHPDDESFGPAPAIARQRREGHAVHLLTLTRGEATRQRHHHGYSKPEMGRVRFEEMQCVAEVLGLSSLEVLDFPDGELAELDPRVLEDVVARVIERHRPDVVVTYPVHGISGHPDHLVTHAVVKRVGCALRERLGVPRRLAFFTLPEGLEKKPAHLHTSPRERIDACVSFTAEDLERAEAALACYRTYRRVIEKHRPLESVAEGVCFELFQETFDPPLDDLTDRLPVVENPAHNASIT